MKKIMLDTNAYSHLARGDERVFKIILSCETVHIPLFVLGELKYGFKNGKRGEENERKLEDFLKKPSVRIALPSTDTADIYSSIRVDLKNAGTPIPENDIWIAATAKEYGCWLISCDKHFSHISGLLHHNPEDSDN